MNQLFKEKWEPKIEYIDYAIQPIVSIISGKIHGIELLIRGVEDCGFTSIEHFFDTAVNDKVLVPLEKALRDKAAKKISNIKNYRNIIIFYNYDHRIMEMPDYHFGFTEEILKQYNIPLNNWCLELTEKTNHNFTSIYNRVLNRAKKSGFKLAIDDFGSGFSNFELLYHSEPDYIKLDKFLIRDINKDLKKASLTTAIVKVAKSLGVTIIAEGVETEAEYYYLKSLDVDLIQGYFIQKPTKDEYSIKLKYEDIESLYNRDRRNVVSVNAYLKEEMVFIPPLKHNNSVVDVLTYFQNSNYDFVPVVDSNFTPVGIILERDLREYIYSPFGRELLTSKLHNITLMDFVKKTPVIDIRSKIEDAMNQVVNYNSIGIFVTNDMTYMGFLTNNSILKILNDLRLKQAFETNPLTGLPGNTVISETINNALKDTVNYNYLLYFDFDNFKPFNDKFGFRVGDRAIQTFATILKKYQNNDSFFIGHVGGDDFFASIKTEKSNPYSIITVFEKIVSDFKDFTSSFYSIEEIMNRCYISLDRNGNKTCFPLLGVSAAILEIPPFEINISEIELSKLIAILKKNAKLNSSKFSLSTLNPSIETYYTV
ncbi:MAG: EAL domain-containing protein [Calditerrivibrio sp.]|nr:EAL domain-containing protein [Calditerrivibrio sp.]